MTAPLAVLQRIRASARSGDERCQMCAAVIGAGHSHVVNVESRALLCTCRPCAQLFSAEDAALAYRRVPDRYLSFPDFRLSRERWDELAIPVGLAFFLRNSKQERTVAFYPGPAGAAESELPLGGDWDELVAEAVPDVEAILLRVQDDGFDCHLVPIDTCYELVGHLRLLWRGFDGGQDARRCLEAFFADIEQRSRPARKGVRLS